MFLTLGLLVFPSELGSVAVEGTLLALVSAAVARPLAAAVATVPFAFGARERVMLGLRLDEPLPLAGLEDALDPAALARLERLGLACVRGGAGSESLELTPRGRFLGGGVPAELLA
jgi:hypothetical protein